MADEIVYVEGVPNDGITNEKAQEIADILQSKGWSDKVKKLICGKYVYDHVLVLNARLDPTIYTLPTLVLDETLDPKDVVVES